MSRHTKWLLTIPITLLVTIGTVFCSLLFVGILLGDFILVDIMQWISYTFLRSYIFPGSIIFGFVLGIISSYFVVKQTIFYVPKE